MNEGAKALVTPRKAKSKSNLGGNFGKAIDLILNYVEGEYPEEKKRELVVLSGITNEQDERIPNIDTSIVRGSIGGIGSLLMTAGMNDQEFGRIICATALALVHNNEELNKFTAELNNGINQKSAENQAESKASNGAEEEE